MSNDNSTLLKLTIDNQEIAVKTTEKNVSKLQKAAAMIESKIKALKISQVNIPQVNIATMVALQLGFEAIGKNENIQNLELDIALLKQHLQELEEVVKNELIDANQDLPSELFDPMTAGQSDSKAVEN